jgi:Na+/melibiose symporter-like transporter
VLLVELMVALGVALLVTAIFAVGLRTRSVWPNWLIFFGLVLLAAWAGGVWITPVGPAVRGIYWVPFLFVGLIMAVLLTAVVAPGSTLTRWKTRTEREGETEIAFSVLVWVLAIGLAMAVFLAYVS